jgi:transposase
LTKLAQASGVATPTREDLARVNRKRKKKGSNDDWTHPHDPDARITKMKDGRTHLAHKAEHTVDLESGAVVAVTIEPADRGDTDSGVDTVLTALDELDAVQPDGDDDREIVADKGYHSTDRVSDWEGIGLRTYISEPKRGRRRWHGQTALRDASIAIAVGFGGGAGNNCCDDAGNTWSDRMRTCTKPARCGERICAATRTS